MEMMELPSQEVLIFKKKFVIGFLVIKLFQEKENFSSGKILQKRFWICTKTLNLNLILLTKKFILNNYELEK